VIFRTVRITLDPNRPVVSLLQARACARFSCAGLSNGVSLQRACTVLCGEDFKSATVSDFKPHYVTPQILVHLHDERTEASALAREA
jgi:hypothetical protein